MHIRAALDKWIEEKQPSEGYRANLERFAVWVDGSFFGWCVQSAYIKSAREELARTAASPYMMNRMRALLKDFFGWCVRSGATSGDYRPVLEAAWPPVKVQRKPKFGVLLPRDEALLYAWCETGSVRGYGWLKPYVTLSIHTGLRQGTIRRLRPEMYEQGGVLRIPAEIMKSGNAHTVYLTEGAINAFAELCTLCNYGPRANQRMNGLLPPASEVWRQFRNALACAGCANVALTPHDLRRTFVARLSAAGVPTHTIMAMGGWKSLGVMVKHYAAQAPEAAARGALKAFE